MLELLDEVVGAVIGVDRITTDMSTIETSLAEGQSVRYITRRRARRERLLSGDLRQGSLADAPTLFYIQDGVRFLPFSSN